MLLITGGSLVSGLGVLVLSCCVLSKLLYRLIELGLRARISEWPPVCLACGFDLTGVPEADDTLLVCPECGGAWVP